MATGAKGLRAHGAAHGGATSLVPTPTSVSDCEPGVPGKVGCPEARGLSLALTTTSLGCHTELRGRFAFHRQALADHLRGTNRLRKVYSAEPVSGTTTVVIHQTCLSDHQRAEKVQVKHHQRGRPKSECHRTQVWFRPGDCPCKTAFPSSNCVFEDKIHFCIPLVGIWCGKQIQEGPWTVALPLACWVILQVK